MRNGSVQELWPSGLTYNVHPLQLMGTLRQQPGLATGLPGDIGNREMTHKPCDPAPVGCRQGLPSSEEANLLIIHKRPGSLVSKFRTIFDHVTPDRWLWPNGVRAQAAA